MPPETAAPPMIPLETTINGRPVSLPIEPRAILLDVLRDRLNLTGAKRSCDTQVCGACTVLLDGDPVSACCTLAYEATGREVETIESLAGPDGLHPIQRAFVDNVAIQCGFCTPGFVLTAKALLAENPSPTRAEIEEFLGGNLCRCTGYWNILEAVEDAAKRMSAPLHPNHTRSGPYAFGAGGRGRIAMTATGATPLTRTAVGHDAPRIDAVAKATGDGQFAGDLRLHGMAYGRLLRSPYAHARIAAIDTSRAEALPGMIAVMTGRDLPSVDAYYGHALKDRPILAIDRVRFVGEPVVAVAAEDPAIADEAITLIDVEYEELPAAVTIEQALAPAAPHLHDVVNLRAGLFHGLGDIRLEPGNVCYHHAFARGDAEAVFAEADIVVAGEYTFPAVYQYSLEPHTTIAQWTGDDELTVWSSCQHPFLVRAELADLYALPVAAVRVVVPFLGGGFGSKSYTKMEPVTSALARVAGRPVRIANSVDEAMVTTRRHGMKAWMRTAATSDGRLLAREVRAWFDTGAYADNGPRVVATGADAAPGPYRWDAVKVDAWGVYTNTSPAGSYRAFGASHLQWCGELQVDEIGRRCGFDALQMRQRNLLERGESVRPGGKPLDADLIGDMRKVAASLDWGSPKPEGIAGRGMSVGLLAAGAHPVSTAAIRMEVDGGVTLLVSSTEVGQGARTVFAQIVAEELALPLDRVRVLGGDTRVTPYDRSTGASRSTTIAGLAVQRAAADIRAQLLAIAARTFDLPQAALEVRDAAVWHEGEAATYPDLVKAHFGMVGGELIGHGEVRPEKGSGSYAEGPVFWEVCIGGAEVTVDPETGRLTVTKAVSVADVGKAINPRLVEAQEMGGALQGIGNALHEEMLFDDTGTLLNATLFEYHVPTIADMPHTFDSNIVENEDGPGPYGAKGVGEGALAGVAAAIATALADAGIAIDELPATPERVWRALVARDERRSGMAAYGGERA